MKLVKIIMSACTHATCFSHSLFEPDNSNTLPPKAAACNLLPTSCPFPQKPSSGTCSPGGKRKEQLLKTFGKTKRAVQFKVSIPNVSKIILQLAIENTRKIWNMNKIKNQSPTCFLTSLPHTKSIAQSLIVQCYQQIFLEINWKNPSYHNL